MDIGATRNIGIGERQSAERHDREVLRDLERLNVPMERWTAERRGPDGRPMTDVLIVGAGVSGLSAALGLQLQGVRNVRILDGSPAGREGPWTTFARMRTVRSTKRLPGPAMGIPSLTFRAWYESRFGLEAWEVLDKAPNQVWMDYLVWFRHVLNLRVENGVTVRRLDPNDDFVGARLDGGETVYARHVVLATGMHGGGQVYRPESIDLDLWPDLAAHTSEEIDFTALAGRTVVVVGSGTAAWDTAAPALEAGAARVDMLTRRPHLPQVNKGRGASFPALVASYPYLRDEDRWRLFAYFQRHQVPPPADTILRTIVHDRFRVRFSSGLSRARRTSDDRVEVSVEGCAEPESFDFLIAGTGFRAGVDASPEIGHLAPVVATWRDRHPDPMDPDCASLGGAPYVGLHYELTELVAGTCPGLRRITLFSHVANASHGPVAAGISVSAAPADLLVRGLTAALAQDDVDHIWQRIVSFDDGELEGTPFHLG